MLVPGMGIAVVSIVRGFTRMVVRTIVVMSRPIVVFRVVSIPAVA